MAEDNAVAAEYGEPVGVRPTPDPSTAIRQAAINALTADNTFLRRATSPNGVPWMDVRRILVETLPDEVIGSLVADPEEWAAGLVEPALTQLFGADGWHKDKVPSKTGSGKMVTYVWVTQDRSQSRLAE